MRQLPDDWRQLAENANLRLKSFRGISEASDVAVTTITRLVFDGRAPSPETVMKLARALRVEPAVIYELAGIDTGELGPWIPPKAANNLMADERQALEQLIRAVTRNRGKDVDGNDDQTNEKMTSRPVGRVRHTASEPEMDIRGAGGPRAKHTGGDDNTRKSGPGQQSMQ